MSLVFLVKMRSFYLWKTKKGIAIADAFEKKLDVSDFKQNKLWLGRGSEPYNRTVKLWLQDNDFEIYSKDSERETAAESLLEL